MSFAEHRAQHGEARMKIRPMAWIAQIGVWILFLATIIAAPLNRALERKVDGTCDYAIETGAVAAFFFQYSLFYGTCIT